jgi:uncharacterized membrane protein
MNFLRPKVSEYNVKATNQTSRLIVVYKMVFGLSELLLGVYITIFGRTALIWYQKYAIQELSEDPHDLLVHLTEGIIPNVLAHHTFLAVYLIVLGGAKIAGAIGLIFKQNWGVDVLVGITFAMFPFQIVRLIRHPSLTESLYAAVGLLIALYLINFQPLKWLSRIILKLKSAIH